MFVFPGLPLFLLLLKTAIATVDDDELYMEAMRMEPHWSHQWQRYLKIHSAKIVDAKVEDDSVKDGFDGFTEEENEIMTKLPRRVNSAAPLATILRRHITVIVPMRLMDRNTCLMRMRNSGC